MEDEETSVKEPLLQQQQGGEERGEGRTSRERGPRYVPAIVAPMMVRGQHHLQHHLQHLGATLPATGNQPAQQTILRAQALSAATAPLLQQQQSQRPRSAPRERRTVRLPPSNDLVQAGRPEPHVAIDVDPIARQRQRQRSAPQDVTGQSPSKNPSFDSVKEVGDDSGRIAVYCVAEKFSKEELLRAVRSSPEPRKGEDGESTRSRLCDGVSALVQGLAWDGEVLAFPCLSQWTGEHAGEVFCFEFGVCVFWGFDLEQENAILSNVVASRGVSVNPLAPADVEDEEFKFQYVLGETPRIQNDTIIMGIHLSQNSIIKLGIAYPLAQSTKLKIYESRIQKETSRFIEIPRTLATTGTVDLSKKEIHQLIGTIFLEKCAVNLLTTVLDTPEFFWDASDALCGLYDSLFEYLEIADRVEILNARFEILEAIFSMLRDQQQNEHSSLLEWIVIILIVVEVIIGLVEILGLVGILPHSRGAI